MRQFIDAASIAAVSALLRSSLLARSLISALEGSLKQLGPHGGAFAAARRDCGKQQWPLCLAKYTAAAFAANSCVA